MDSLWICDKREEKRSGYPSHAARTIALRATSMTPESVTLWFTTHTNHLGISLKWLGTSGWGPGVCISNMLPGEAAAPAPWRILWVAKSPPFRHDCIRDLHSHQKVVAEVQRWPFHFLALAAPHCLEVPQNLAPSLQQASSILFMLTFTSKDTGTISASLP